MNVGAHMRISALWTRVAALILRDQVPTARAIVDYMTEQQMSEMF